MAIPVVALERCSGCQRVPHLNENLTTIHNGWRLCAACVAPVCYDCRAPGDLLPCVDGARRCDGCRQKWWALVTKPDPQCAYCRARGNVGVLASDGKWLCSSRCSTWYEARSANLPSYDPDPCVRCASRKTFRMGSSRKCDACGWVESPPLPVEAVKHVVPKPKSWHEAVADEYADLRDRKAALLAWSRQLAGRHWTNGKRPCAECGHGWGIVEHDRPGSKGFFCPDCALKRDIRGGIRTPRPVLANPFAPRQVTLRGLGEAALAMRFPVAVLVCALTAIWFGPADADYSVVGPVAVALALVVHGVLAAKARPAPPPPPTGLGDFLTTTKVY